MEQKLDQVSSLIAMLLVQDNMKFHKQLKNLFIVNKKIKDLEHLVVQELQKKKEIPVQDLICRLMNNMVQLSLEHRKDSR